MTEILFTIAKIYDRNNEYTTTTTGHNVTVVNRVSYYTKQGGGHVIL